MRDWASPKAPPWWRRARPGAPGSGRRETPGSISSTRRDPVDPEARQQAAAVSPPSPRWRRSRPRPDRGSRRGPRARARRRSSVAARPPPRSPHQGVPRPRRSRAAIPFGARRAAPAGSARTRHGELARDVWWTPSSAASLRVAARVVAASEPTTIRLPSRLGGRCRGAAAGCAWRGARAWASPALPMKTGLCARARPGRAMRSRSASVFRVADRDPLPRGRRFRRGFRRDPAPARRRGPTPPCAGRRPRRSRRDRRWDSCGRAARPPPPRGGRPSTRTRPARVVRPWPGRRARRGRRRRPPRAASQSRVAAVSAAGWPRRVESIFLEQGPAGSHRRPGRRRAAPPRPAPTGAAVARRRTGPQDPGKPGPPPAPRSRRRRGPAGRRRWRSRRAPVRSSARMSQRAGIVQRPAWGWAGAALSTVSSAGSAAPPSPKRREVQAVATGTRIAVTTTQAATRMVAGPAASA